MDIFKYENEYLEKIKKEKKPHTYNTYKKAIKKFKKFEDTDLAKYKKYLEENKIPFTSIKLLISVARNFLNYVKEKENITFKNIKLKNQQITKEDFFTLNEFKNIIKKVECIMDKKTAAFIIYLLATTNLKLSQIQRINTENITINNEEILINIDNKKIRFLKNTREYNILKELYYQNRLNELNKESSGIYKYFKRILGSLNINSKNKNLHTLKKSQKHLINEYGINFLD